MNATTLTAIGGIVVPLLVLGMVPILLQRQTRKREAALAAKLAERDAAAAEKLEIKERAERDAQAAAGDIVSWEKITAALSATVQEERAANRERLVEQREQFTAEMERLRRLTDDDMGRAKAEIARLADQIRALEERLAKLGPRVQP